SRTPMASRSSWSRFPPITFSAGTRDRRHRQDDELCAGQMSAPGQGQMSTAGRDQKSAFPSATNAPSEASIRMWRPEKPDAPPLGPDLAHDPGFSAGSSL